MYISQTRKLRGAGNRAGFLPLAPLAGPAIMAGKLLVKKLAQKAVKKMVKGGIEWATKKIIDKVRGRGVFRGIRRTRRGGNILKRGLNKMAEYTLDELQKTYRGTVNKENIDKMLQSGYNVIKNRFSGKRGTSVYRGRRRQRARGCRRRRAGIVTQRHAKYAPHHEKTASAIYKILTQNGL